jgi:hypothetical protein
MRCAYNKGKAKCSAFVGRRSRRAGNAAAPCVRRRMVCRLAQSDGRCVGEVGGWFRGLTEDGRHGQGTVGGGMISCHLWLSQWFAELLRGEVIAHRLACRRKGTMRRRGGRCLPCRAFCRELAPGAAAGRALTDSLNARGKSRRPWS